MTKYSRSRGWFILLAAFAAASPSPAAEEPAGQSEAPNKVTTKNRGQDDSPRPPQKESAERALDSFTPSERIPAGSAVSFPVDI